MYPSEGSSGRWNPFLSRDLSLVGSPSLGESDALASVPSVCLHPEEIKVVSNLPKPPLFGTFPSNPTQQKAEKETSFSVWLT